MSHVRRLLIIAVAVCISSGSVITGTLTDSVEEKKSNSCQLNKGRFANPTLNVGALKENIRAGYEDLKCSYVFRIVLHLKLIKKLWSWLGLFGEKGQMEKIETDMTFWNEGRQILEFMIRVHVDQLQSANSTLQSELGLFWILIVYNEREKKHLSFAKDEGDAKKSLSVAYTAVTQLFGKCLNGCIAYDQQTGWPLSDEDFFQKEIDKRVVLAVDLVSTTTLIGASKTEFNQQVGDNKKIIAIHDQQCMDQLKMKRMCLNDVHDSDEDMTALVQHLGMIDQKSQTLFVSKLKKFYNFATSTTEPLHRQMYGLQRFQQYFIKMLIAIALRIAQEHLQCLKNRSNTDSDFESQTKAMHAVLTDFFGYFKLAVYDDDTFLSVVIQGYSEPKLYKDRTQIEVLIKHIDQSLDNIKTTIQSQMSLTKNLNMKDSDPFHSIRHLFKIKKNHSKHDASQYLVDLANKYQIQPAIDDKGKLLEENVLRGKILIGFIRKKFKCCNFYFIWLYSSIVTSEWVDDLRDLENKIKKGGNNPDLTNVDEDRYKTEVD